MTDTRPGPPLPGSLWAATAVPGPACPPLVDQVTADACVVGAGFSGLVAALTLAETGAQVVLLESAEPGWGASGRTGGQVIPGLKLDPEAIERRFEVGTALALIELAGNAPNRVFALIDRHRIDCDADRCGWIQAAHCARAMAEVESRAAQWRRRGDDVEVLDQSAMASRIGTGIYVGGLLDRRGGALQPLSYARGLARAAVTAGACICGRSPATAIIRQGSRWRVSTPSGAVLADQVLLCTNAYTDALWPGLRESFIPVFSYQIATDPLPPELRDQILTGGHVVSDTRRLLAYFRFDAAGRLLVGGRGRFRDSGDPSLYGEIVALLRQLFPKAAQLPIAYRWGGQVALTTDHLPHLHELAPGVTAGLGYNGRGVAMATAMGQMLASRATGTPFSELPFPRSPLRPIPLAALRRPVLQAAVWWKRTRDRHEIQVSMRQPQPVHSRARSKSM